jgi:RNA polymerase sigma factor (sigma-70 family)
LETRLLDSAQPPDRPRKRRRLTVRAAGRSLRTLEDAPAPVDEGRRLSRRGHSLGSGKTPSAPPYFQTSLMDHDILTREQEFELGTAVRRSLALQVQLEDVLLEAKERLREKAQEEALQTMEEDWSALMGSGRSDDMASFDYKTLDAEEDLDHKLSVVDADDGPWYQQEGELDADTALVSGIDRPIQSQYLMDSDLDILTDDELMEHLDMTRIQVQSVLLEGAVARDTLITSNVRLVVSIAKKWANQAGHGSQNLVSIYRGSWDRPSLDEAIQEGIIGLARAVDKFEPGRNLRFSTYATWWVTNYVRKCFQDASTPGLRVPAAFHVARSNFKKLLRQYHEAGETAPPFEDLARQLGIKAKRLHYILRATKPAQSIDAPISLSVMTAAGKAGNVESTNNMVMADNMVDHDARPEDRVEWSFLRQSLENAMANELAPHERDVIRLRLGLDDGVTRTVKQVAEECGGIVTQSQIRAAEKRAFQKLRSPTSLANYKLMAYLDFAGIDSSTTSIN